MFRDIDWAGYESLLAIRGERRRPRIAYLDGAAELMTPSRGHERVNAGFGYLVAAYCTELGIAWTSYRSWTLKDETREAGLEPDDCFIFGDDPESKDRPELAIEVVWTHGDLDKLEIYRRLGISEVWFWIRDAITVHVLGESGYRVSDRSAYLPTVDLAALCRFAQVTPTSAAVAQLVAHLRGA